MLNSAFADSLNEMLLTFNDSLQSHMEAINDLTNANLNNQETSKLSSTEGCSAVIDKPSKVANASNALYLTIVSLYF